MIKLEFVVLKIVFLFHLLSNMTLSFQENHTFREFLIGVALRILEIAVVTGLLLVFRSIFKRSFSSWVKKVFSKLLKIKENESDES